MINENVYTQDYIKRMRLEKKCDPVILEKTIFAFGLLEALKKSGADFIFKGGTSLMLLLEKPQRLSTDIDIIVEPGYDIEAYIRSASEMYPFIHFEENKRTGANNIVKQHFRFYYKSLKDDDKEVSILLDVLFEKNHYAKVEERELKNELIETSGNPIIVKVPSVDSILGDKLTAFAPYTIGVKPVMEKETGEIVDKKTEVIKQFFDIASLFDVMENIEDVKKSYKKVAIAEIGYRGIDVTIEDCLRDTFNAAISIFSKGRMFSEMYKEDLLPGIRSLSSFLINVRFNGETAHVQAAKVMLLAACILAGTNIEEIPEGDLFKDEYKSVNLMKKIDKDAFNMAAYAIDIYKSCE